MKKLKAMKIEEIVHLYKILNRFFTQLELWIQQCHGRLLNSQFHYLGYFCILMHDSLQTNLHLKYVV